AAEGAARFGPELAGRGTEQQPAVPAAGLAPAFDEHPPRAALDLEAAQVDRFCRAIGRRRCGGRTGRRRELARRDADPSLPRRRARELGDALPPTRQTPPPLEDDAPEYGGRQAEQARTEEKRVGTAERAGGPFRQRPVADPGAERERQRDDEEQVQRDQK